MPEGERIFCGALWYTWYLMVSEGTPVHHQHIGRRLRVIVHDASSSLSLLILLALMELPLLPQHTMAKKIAVSTTDCHIHPLEGDRCKGFSLLLKSASKSLF